LLYQHLFKCCAILHFQRNNNWTIIACTEGEILQNWLVTMHQQHFSISICQDCMKQRTLIASSYQTDKLMLSWSSVSLFDLVSLLHKILDYSNTLIATVISPWYQPKQLIVFFSPRLHWHVQVYGWWNE
jgi:hypothetical protein